MRNYQNKSNAGALPDSITTTKFGAGEFNSIATELENAVSTSGQTLAPADGTGEVGDQLAMALAIYGAGGATYHLDTGVVNAYILSPVSPHESPNAYFDGLTVMFVPGSINTSASTVNINSLGVKSVTLITGDPLNGGEIAGPTIIKYSSANDRFEIVYNISSYTGNVSVHAFGAIGDNSTDNQTAIENAVTFANGYGVTLYWPDGIYVTSDTIPNFHDVNHIGRAKIKRGSDVWYLYQETTEENTIYVSSTGNIAYDGLSSSEATTLDQAIVILEKYSNTFLDGVWSIQLSAGTYNRTTTCSVPSHAKGRSAITIKGPTISHPNVPTAILDGGSNAITGLSYIGSGQFSVKYIKFQNFLPSVGGGVYCRDKTILYTQNVHCDNCTDGIYAYGSCVLRIEGGIIENCTYGVGVGGCCTGTIGYGALSTSDGVQLDSNNTGIIIGEMSSLHTDYNLITNSTNIGLLLYDNARSNCVASDFQLNAVAVETRSGSVFTNSGAVFNIGTGNANTINVNYYGELGIDTLTERQSKIVFSDRSGVRYHTGDTSETLLVDGGWTIPANWFIENNRKIKLDIYGKKIGSAGSASLQIYIGATMISSITLPSSAANDFKLTFEIISTGTASQRHWYTLIDDVGSNNLIALNVSSAVDMTSDQDIDIAGTLSNAGDTIQVLGITFSIF